MNSDAAVDVVRRLSSEERREQIIAAAMAVFGAKGYSGTTTDDVARAAGVSQPYVVRLFGTKEKLFLAALQDALDRLLAAFRARLVGDPAERKHHMGEAYFELLQVRGLHMILSQSFLLGGDPAIGAAARDGFGQVWRFLREEAGFDAEYAQQFIAYGMLTNTMVGMRAISPAGREAGLGELLDLCFPDSYDAVAQASPGTTDPW